MRIGSATPAKRAAAFGVLPSIHRRRRRAAAAARPVADAVARLEAAVVAAPDGLAAGVCARLAPRDANLTGSYTLAELTGRLGEPAPWTIGDGADAEGVAAWLAWLPWPGALPGLLAAARVMAEGLPGIPRGDRLALGPAYVAAPASKEAGGIADGQRL